MEPFVKPQAMQGVLSFMSGELVDDLREVGLVLDCRECKNSYIKPSPLQHTQCPCGNIVDQSKEPWAASGYIPPVGGTIPTVEFILNKLYRMGDDKAESVAEQVGMSRSAFYRAMSGGVMPRKSALLALADICANRGLHAEADALERYWARQRRPYKLRGKRLDKMEDYGMTTGFWEAKADERAEGQFGKPNPAFFPPPDYKR